MIEPFEIDADVARARSLPPEWYVDPEALACERRGVFARTWQLAARAQELAEVGSYVATEVAGKPVLVVRAAEGEGGLRAWSNVCPHRAGPLASGAGKRRTIQCGYHGWTFDLEGRLVRAPEAEGRDLSDVTLAALEVGAWGPHVFVALEPAASLAETFAHVGAPARELAFVTARDYPVEADWKVYVDNYLEGYHIPVVHPELSRSSTTPTTAPRSRAGPRASSRRCGRWRRRNRPPSASTRPSSRARKPSTTGSSPTSCSTSTRACCRPTW